MRLIECWETEALRRMRKKTIEVVVYKVVGVDRKGHFCRKFSRELRRWGASLVFKFLICSQNKNKDLTVEKWGR